MGMNGLPPSYAVRKNDNPDRLGPHADAVDETTAYAPLNGVNFQTDKSTVHQYSVSFTTGEILEEWTYPILRKKNEHMGMAVYVNTSLVKTIQ